MNAKCNKDHTEQITIAEIDDLVVEFNGQTIPFDTSHVSGDVWSVIVSGSSIPVAGELTYKNGSTIIKQVTVDCS